MSAIVLSEPVGLTLLPQLATTKLPHRLQGIAIDRAVPAQIEAISVLIWRHRVAGQLALEVHTASRNLEPLKTCLELCVQA